MVHTDTQSSLYLTQLLAAHHTCRAAEAAACMQLTDAAPVQPTSSARQIVYACEWTSGSRQWLTMAVMFISLNLHACIL
eukprot:scaffold89070_cov21-Tisochrysis_lutea.AAC.1